MAPPTNSLLRVGVVVVGTLAGCALIARLARTGDFELLATYALVLAVTGLLVAAFVPAAGMAALAGSAEDRRTTRRLVRDGGALLASATIQCGFGMAAYPLTFRPGEDHDPSWFGAVAATTLLLGLGALGVGYLVGLLVLKPLQLVATSALGAFRGDRRDRRRVLFGLMFLLVVAFAVSLQRAGAEGAPGLRVGPLVRALLGIGIDDTSAWIWVARALALALLGVLSMLVRNHRADREASTTAAPPHRSGRG